MFLKNHISYNIADLSRQAIVVIVVRVKVVWKNREKFFEFDSTVKVCV